MWNPSSRPGEQTMKHTTEEPIPTRDDGWLQRECPEAWHMLRAVEGDDAAFDWLKEKGAALYLFTKAVAGDRRAAAALVPGHGLHLDDLFGMIWHYDLAHWLGERHPELYLLFEAIKGDDAVRRRLKRRKAHLARLAEAVAGLYHHYQQEGPPEDPDPPSADGAQGLAGPAAADVGCLIGELHLSKGDYERAVEAFSRALESEPTADAHEGRAQAYRALAERDEVRARALRETPAVPAP
jgi:tetratricopeptide (TPR) repeat protein